MNIGNEGLAHLVQGAQEGGLLAVAAVHPDPAEPHPRRPRRTHHRERESAPGAHRARLWRDLGALASGRLVDPALRQVEPHVDRRVPRTVAPHGEHRHLTVIDLTQAAAPLSSNANRAISWFDEAARSASRLNRR
jgi:hypothetical protein